ncbi:hypothetical protein WMY93_015698 [Mugilogobius chulae]|uniref:Transmembrane protein 132E n=1 Tax=Mugilogobius chulae TaxID=88201 RepID=A0AAW0P1U0_9GOBI
MGVLTSDWAHGDWPVSACVHLWILLTTVGVIVTPPTAALLSTSATPLAPPPSLYLPAHFKMSNAQLAFFLRETPVGGQGGGGASERSSHPLQRAQSFVVFQTKELPAINITFGPFARDQTLSKELLQPAGPLDIPGTLTVNWKVRAFIVQTRVFSSNPTVQVFFYIAGRDWDDFRIQDKLPCVRLHAFRDVREIQTSCRMKGNLAQCLAQLDLPQSWFNTNVAPLGRRKGSAEALLEGVSETLQAELYYTLHEASPEGGCVESPGQRGGPGAAHHPLLRIAASVCTRPGRSSNWWTNSWIKTCSEITGQTAEAWGHAEDLPVPHAQLVCGPLHPQKDQPPSLHLYNRPASSLVHSERHIYNKVSCKEDLNNG